MGIREYEAAIDLIRQYPNLQDFVGPRSNELVSKAEFALGIVLPTTYRRFVAEYGAGNFGSTEIYGVVNENFEKAAVPNGIWYTLDSRKNFGLPIELIVIYNDGGGLDFAIDTSSQKNTDFPVVAYPIAGRWERAKMQIIDNEFGNFLLDMVRHEVELYKARR